MIREEPDEEMDPFFSAASEAVEESILNVMISAEDMTGHNMNFVPALPHDQLREILARYSDLLNVYR